MWISFRYGLSRIRKRTDRLSVPFKSRPRLRMDLQTLEDRAVPCSQMLDGGSYSADTVQAHSETSIIVPAAPPIESDGAPSLTVDVAIGAGIITTVAGTGAQGYGGDGGPAVGAPLNFPTGVAADTAGNLFIADAGNNRVRRVDAATGVITTVAGTGESDHNGDGIPATAANLGNPIGVAVDAAGNLFIADYGNNRVRRVDTATGFITTVAGTGIGGYGGDGGPAAGASLLSPAAVAVDAVGNLFIADQGNYRVRRVDAVTGVITTVAGSDVQGYGGDGGPATDAALITPTGVAVDAAGNLFIADSYNSRVRRVDAVTGVITTVAGTSGAGFGGDGGPAAAAPLAYPAAVAVDAAGNLFITDSGNGRVRRVDAVTGLISSVAGDGTFAYGGDGGPAAGASLNLPTGAAVDAGGNLFIADYGNNRVRKVAAQEAHEGDPATYTFTVINTSLATTDPVTVTSVTDTMLGDLTGAALAANGGNPIVLAPGQTFRFHYASAPLNAGTITNVVAVGGRDDENTPTTAAYTYTLKVSNVAPHITVDEVGPGSIIHGQPATYTFKITNTSSASTDPVTVTSFNDDLMGDLICVAKAANGGKDIVLTPGQSFTFSACSTTFDSVRVVNVVTVTAHDDENTIATASDTAIMTVNYPPVAVDDILRHNPVGLVTLAVALNDTDPNGDLLVGSVDLDPTMPGQQATRTTAGEGTWAVDYSGNVTFTPEAGFTHDPTPVRYTISDSTGLVSNEATIAIDFVPNGRERFLQRQHRRYADDFTGAGQRYDGRLGSAAHGPDLRHCEPRQSADRSLPGKVEHRQDDWGYYLHA